MKFLGAKDSGKIAIRGYPLDDTESFRPGTRFAPAKIRAVSEALETYSPYSLKDLEDVDFVDLMDMQLPIGLVEESIDIIKEDVKNIYSIYSKAVFIGGEHTITLAIVSALKEMYDNLAVIYIDAHTDLRETYLKNRFSHACTLKRITELGVETILIGARSGTKDEFEFAKTNLTLFHPFNLEVNFKSLKEKIDRKPVYISIDIDVIDPSMCPAVGCPEPAGVNIKELTEFILKLKDINIIGADVVELCPVCDYNDISAITAAFLIREILLVIDS